VAHDRVRFCARAILRAPFAADSTMLCYTRRTGGKRLD
jgi:hypothetical protein